MKRIVVVLINSNISLSETVGYYYELENPSEGLINDPAIRVLKL
jgi:hypothetical protein